MFILNPKSFGLAAGVLWGLTMLLITWLSLFTGYAFSFLSFMTDLYPGYSISFLGSLVGFFYGFLAAFVQFYLFAWFYNFLEH
jgi:hypothetical protein